ncbi:unnamed protein product [Phytophthora fragariaefolia]|uniref:Unnamed protein product n=1 Tax=Phytophthora fragariaefolia TaxID=1490495 RepID=A0A9W6X4P2_9STRA|nr:unnamed protein product [Phytophthora fragariaefolia]
MLCGTSTTSSTSEEISDSNDSGATYNAPSSHGAVGLNKVGVSSPIELGEMVTLNLKVSHTNIETGARMLGSHSHTGGSTYRRK